MKKKLKLLEKLYEKTKEGELNWRRTEKVVSPNSFEISVEPHYIIRLTKISDTRLTVLNQNSQEIFSFGTSDLHKDSRLQNSCYCHMLQKLFEESKRIAIDVNSVLDKIIEKLDS